MRNQFALLLAVVLALFAAPVAAQEILAPPEGTGAGDLPPGVDLSSQLPEGAVLEGEVVPEGEVIEPMAETIGEDAVGTFGGYGGDPAHLAASYPALFESSGSWLRRGFWYTEADYMLLNRGWDRKGLLFAFDAGQTGVGQSPGYAQPGLSVPGFGQVLTLNPLIIAGSKPGADGLARVTLGRFLFRDSSNRDHNLQATFFGGGSWKQDASVEAGSVQGLTVNDFIDRINPSFDGSRRMSFDYQTDFNSIETNYLVKARMGRDQMVLQPDGHWVRSAQTSQTYSFLAGVRYARITEGLDILAESDPDNAQTQGGFYDIKTANNLAGGQLGVGIAQETARWSFGLNVKGGSYWNRMYLDSEFRAGPDLVPSRGETNSTEDTLSFIGEAQLLGKWHLRPNVSLRAGLEILYVNALALAPFQANFIPGGYDPIAAAGDIFCMGTSIGIEAYR